MLIFSGTSNNPLASSIARELNLELSPVEIFTFPDGEKRITIKEKVVGQTAIVIQSTNSPADSNYMELFLLVDSLKRSGAEFVKVIMPYMGYQRQDHVFRDGEGVSLEVIANILQAVGVSEFYSFDLHTIRIPELFKIPAHNISALSIFAQKIREIADGSGFIVNSRNNNEKPTISNEPLSMNDIVLISPDMGGIRRIKELSEVLGVSYATIVKDRDLDKGDIHDVALNGDVKGKIALMIDDMISTGKTMAYGADLLLENGADNVFAFATHAVLSADASDILQQSRIEKVFVTDTVSIPEERKFPKLKVLSIAKTAADILRNA